MTEADSTGGRLRLGVFGGTFDPLHLGHLAVAQDVLEELELDRVVLVPAGSPPHKESGVETPATLRLRMVREAVAEDPRFEVLPLEVEREGPSWTVDTLGVLREQRPDAELFLLMGVDQWRSILSWKAPRRIAELARIVVMGRAGEAPAGLEGVAGSLPHIAVPVTRLDISSTDLRRRVRDGRSVRFLVPESVRRLIAEERLYH